MKRGSKLQQSFAASVATATVTAVVAAALGSRALTAANDGLVTRISLSSAAATAEASESRDFYSIYGRLHAPSVEEMRSLSLPLTHPEASTRLSVTESGDASATATDAGVAPATTATAAAAAAAATAAAAPAAETSAALSNRCKQQQQHHGSSSSATAAAAAPWQQQQCYSSSSSNIAAVATAAAAPGGPHEQPQRSLFQLNPPLHAKGGLLLQQQISTHRFAAVAANLYPQTWTNNHTLGFRV